MLWLRCRRFLVFVYFLFSYLSSFYLAVICYCCLARGITRRTPIYTDGRSVDQFHRCRLFKSGDCLYGPYYAYIVYADIMIIPLIVVGNILTYYYGMVGTALATVGTHFIYSWFVRIYLQSHTQLKPLGFV